jgi:hypothetical protein
MPLGGVLLMASAILTPRDDFASQIRERRMITLANAEISHYNHALRDLRPLAASNC